MDPFGRPSIGDASELEIREVTLSDKLKVFKSSQFDPNGYLTSKCQTMTEKEIKHMCSFLGDLKKASAEEMRKSVYANYTSFIRTSKEISDLEGELLSMRNLLNTQAALVHGLAEGVRVDALFTGSEGSATLSLPTSDMLMSKIMRGKYCGRQPVTEATTKPTDSFI